MWKRFTYLLVNRRGATTTEAVHNDDGDCTMNIDTVLSTGLSLVALAMAGAIVRKRYRRLRRRRLAVVRSIAR
jgi:hypothetical protein